MALVKFWKAHQNLTYDSRDLDNLISAAENREIQSGIEHHIKIEVPQQMPHFA